MCQKLHLTFTGLTKTGRFLLYIIPMFIGLNAHAVISITFNVTQPTCYGLPNGSVTATATGGVAPYSYVWSTGQTGPTINGITAGSYSVTVTDAVGASGTQSVTVSQPPLVTVTFQTNQCNIPFSVTATGGGGIPPYTYYWTTGQTTPTISNLPSGTYCVTVTDSHLCGVVDCITLNYIPLNVSIVATGVTCPGASNGTVAATASGGAPPYSYLWSNGATTASQQNLVPGLYSVTVTDINGCTATASATVANKPPIVINIATSPPTCAGYSNGSATANVSGGTPPYTYFWSTGQTTATINNLAAGVYSVTVTDANGCTKTSSVTLAPYSNLSVGALGTAETCPGFNNGFLTGNASGGIQPYSFHWSNGATTQVVTNVPPGTYSLTVTDAAGCMGTATATILAAPPFAINVTGSNVTTCGVTNGVATATVVTGIGPFTYLWSNGGTTPSISGLGAGTYSVTVTNGANCIATGSIVITAPPPVFVTINSTPLVCQGSATGTATAVVTGGTAPFSFLWSTGATTQTITNLPPGTYSVTVTDAVGCTDDASTVINAAPAVNVNITGTAIVCGAGNTGSATALVNGGTPPFSYLWSTGATSVSINNLVEGSYSVTVTDANGCSDMDSFTIDIIDNLTVNVITQHVLCFGGNTGAAVASGNGGNGPYSFLWSNGATTAAINNLTAGNYSVTLTDANGCQASRTVSISQPTDLTVNINASNLVCPGATTGAATATAGGGTMPYTYVWSNGGNTSTINNLGAGVYSVTVTDSNGCTETSSVTINQAPAINVNIEAEHIVCGPEDSGDAMAVVTGGTPPFTFMWSTGSNQESIENLDDGTYSVTVTDANGCSATAETTIIVVSDFSLSIIPRNLLCHGDNSGGILVEPTGGTPPYTFMWSNGFTGPELSNLAAGTYSVTVTESNGCTASETITITEPPVLTISGIGINAECFNTNTGAATATAVGGTPPYSFVWSNGQTGPNATNLAAGTYSVTVTDVNLCTASTMVTIGQPEALDLTVSTGIINCAGSNTGSATAIVTGGTGPYTYMWSNGATTQTASNLTAGIYSVTVTDAHGCTISDATIAVAELPQINISLNINHIICVNTPIGAITATVTGGAGPYTFHWSNGATTSSISGLAAGTYSVTVTDINGCMASTSGTVNQVPSLMVNVAGTNISCFGGANGSATANVTGGTPPFTFIWSNGANTATITGLTPGTYSVTVNDSAGCSGQSSVTITQPTQITIMLTGTNAVCNGTATGSAMCTAGGGTPPYSFSWSNGATGANTTGLAAGTYTVTVTDANSCTTTGTVTIGQPSAVTITATPQNGTCVGGSSGSAVATGNGGTPPYTYHWSNGQNTATATNLTAGTHSVTVTDSHGCTASTSVNIANLPSPSCTAEVIHEITTYQGSDGQAQVTATSGQPPYTFHWSTGQNTPIISNLGIGTYTVTVTDANGCTSTCSVTLNGPSRVGDFVWIDIDRDGIQDAGEVGVPGITVIITGTAESTPYADTTVTNGNGLYYFDVPPGHYKITFLIPTSIYTISPANQGSNDAIDSDADPIMMMTDFFDIGHNELNLTFDAGIYPPCVNVTNPGVIGYDQTLCGPGNDPAPIISVVDPSGGYGTLEYLWMMSTVPGPFNAQTWTPIPNSNSPSYDPGPLYETTYYTRCVRRDSCTTYIEGGIVTITVDDVAVANITGSPVVCSNQSLTYTVAGNTPNPQVQWTLGPGIVAESPLNQATIHIHFTSFGLFTIYASVTENGCTATNFKKITVSSCFSGLVIAADVEDQQAKKVKIHWAIPTDVNADYYVVTRSADGENFTAVGQVTSPASADNTMQHFEYFDVAAKKGRTYYQVEAVYNSDHVMSNIASAIIYGESQLAMFYPNPVDNQLTIELFETFNDDVTIDLNTANGVQMRKVKVPANTERVVLDLSDYPAGAYFVRLRIGKSDVKTYKVIKR